MKNYDLDSSIVSLCEENKKVPQYVNTITARHINYQHMKQSHNNCSTVYVQSVKKIFAQRKT